MAAQSSRVHHSLLIQHASQIVQIVRDRELVVVGESMNKLAILDRTETDGLSMVVGRCGRIVALGLDTDVNREYHECQFDKVIDASNKSIIPGKCSLQKNSFLNFILLFKDLAVKGML